MDTRLLASLCIATASILSGCASSGTAPSASAPAAAPAAQATASTQPAVKTQSDSEIASNFKGEWTGKWSLGPYGGKIVLIVTGTQGNAIDGELHVFDLPSGDVKNKLEKTVIEKGQLVGGIPAGLQLEAKLVDAGSLKGNLIYGSYRADVDAKRN